jgi:Peptidase family M28
LGRKTDSVLAIAIVLFLVVSAFLSIYLQSPPHAVASSAPAGEFSSGRAMKQLEAIAQQPHPIGSSAHQEVRDYILKELSAQGLSPEIQETTVARPGGRGFVVAGTVRNIAARLSGTDSQKAIMLVGHYDSAPTSLGASDDGSAVVVLLETLRALKAGSPLKNDLIFLFTDGEEVGLLGAKAFVAEHPWARDVAVVLNFEARGHTGPAIMFETSGENGRLIREFAQAVPFPVANSLSYEIYKRLPNDTDLTVFKAAGLAGFNFAYIRGLTHYHTLLDSVANIDERSLQHQGSYALSLARHLGGLDLSSLRETNAVYFSFGPIFVNYSQAWVAPVTLLVVLLFMGVVWLGFRRKQLSLSGIGAGLLALLLCAIGAAAAVSLIWSLINSSLGISRTVPHGDPYNKNLYLIGFVLFTFALTSAIWLRFRRKVSVHNLTVGALLWWLLLLVMSSLFWPGSSYLLTWPLLFALAWLALTVKDAAPVSWMRLVILFLCATAGIVLLAPTIHLIFAALNIGASGLVMILAVLLFGLLMPLLDRLLTPTGWLLPGAALALGFGFILTAIVTTRSDRDHPRQDHLFYRLDADKQEAAWFSQDQQPDAWTSQFFPAKAERVAAHGIPLLAGRTLLKSPAPVAPLEAPTIALLDDHTTGDIRTLNLRVQSPRRAPIISVHVAPDTEVIEAAVNGKRIDNLAARDEWGLRYFSLPPEGMELTLRVKSNGSPAKIRVIDQSYGLPELPGTPLKPRPEGIIPVPSLYSDLTLVDKLLNL